ncbi:MAG TPA: hydroxyethylthiazole kinase [Candidatus Dormibacteraeota bacterium]|nr:hydroxyethylthiazole kinase [Candidatus Dormibacteraeota bacterium]
METDFEQAAKLALVRVAERRPLVHHVTNWVTANDVANLTLAYGALPVMATGPEEAAEMAASSQVLVLNLGTPSGSTLEVMLAAGRAAAERDVPIVLDPVGAGATTFRTEAARRLLAELPIAVLRGNRGEVGALIGEGAVRGVEAVGNEDVRRVAQEAGRRLGVVVAVTGPVDVVAGGGTVREVRNGDPLLTTITGSGCMATAAVAVMLAAGGEPSLQAALALATFGLAAERAAGGSRGPGTFRARLLDAVAALRTQGVGGLRITEAAG